MVFDLGSKFESGLARAVLLELKVGLQLEMLLAHLDQCANYI